MQKLKNRKGSILRTILIIFLAVILIFAAGAGGAWYLFYRTPEAVQPVITSELIGERLKDAGDLVSLEYYYKNIASIDREKLNIWGIGIPFTSSRAILSYEGVIKYGIEIGQVNPEIDGNKIILTIPQSKIISHEVPEEKIEIFDSGRNMFNPITIQDYMDFQTEQKVKMIEEAAEKGFPQAAQEKAFETLSMVLNAMPGMDEYTITANYIR